MAMAVLTSTASAPISIASAASLGARSRIDDYGHRGLLDDDFDLRTRLDPPITSDRRTERITVAARSPAIASLTPDRH